MGFSLVGPSGDTPTNTTAYNFSASQNPQADVTGAGTLSVNVSPLQQGGKSFGSTSPQIYDLYQPVDLAGTGTNLGDAALAAIQGLAGSQASALSPGSSPGTAGTTTSLSQLLSGNTLYWILGAIVIFFLAEHR